MTKKTGTLVELRVRKGDVVECVRHSYSLPDVLDVGGIYTINSQGNVEGKYTATGSFGIFRIVSRASKPDTPRERATTAERPNTPKPLNYCLDMTDAEIGALVRAKNEGKTIQRWCKAEWLDDDYPDWSDCYAYRIRPEPKRETVTIYINEKGETSPRDGRWAGPAARAINFYLIDGKIDDSIPPNMERVKWPL